MYECGVEPKFKCSVCSRTFKHKSSWRSHSIIVHKTIVWDVFLCYICFAFSLASMQTISFEFLNWLKMCKFGLYSDPFCVLFINIFSLPSGFYLSVQYQPNPLKHDTCSKYRVWKCSQSFHNILYYLLPTFRFLFVNLIPQIIAKIVFN